MIFVPGAIERKTFSSPEIDPIILTGLAALISSPLLAGVFPKKIQNMVKFF